MKIICYLKGVVCPILLYRQLCYITGFMMFQGRLFSDFAVRQLAKPLYDLTKPKCDQYHLILSNIITKYCLGPKF